MAHIPHNACGSLTHEGAAPGRPGWLVTTHLRANAALDGRFHAIRQAVIAT